MGGQREKFLALHFVWEGILRIGLLAIKNLQNQEQEEYALFDLFEKP